MKYKGYVNGAIFGPSCRLLTVNCIRTKTEIELRTRISAKAAKR